MTIRYGIVMAFYFGSFGFSLFYLNKYVITFVPVACLVVTFVALKQEFQQTDFTRLFQSHDVLGWMRKAFVWGTISLAACNLIFHYSDNGTLKQQLLFQLPVLSIYTALFIPILEETIFRKIIFGSLCTRFNFWIGAIASSLLFAGGHLSWNGFIGYFIVGMIYCYVYKKSGSMLPTVAAHALMNFAAIWVSSLTVMSS